MTDLSRLRHFSTAIFSETKSVTPIFFFIFGVSTLSTKSRGEMKKISPWEDFGANVLNWQTSLLCAQVPHQPIIAPVPERIYWQ